MPRNVEIKAHVKEMETVRQAVEALAQAPPQQISQEDTFFHTRGGRLKLRVLAEDRGQLVYYERADSTAPKESHYLVAPIADPAATREVLASALGVRGQVRKQRTLYLVGQTRVHLDEVQGLGAFLELEVVLRPDQSAEEGEVIAQELMRKLNIESQDLVDAAYIDLLERGTM